MENIKELQYYAAQTPHNREERRKLLKTQGWYYVAAVNAETNEWIVYKVNRTGGYEIVASSNTATESRE